MSVIATFFRFITKTAATSEHEEQNANVNASANATVNARGTMILDETGSNCSEEHLFSLDPTRMTFRPLSSINSRGQEEQDDDEDDEPYAQVSPTVGSHGLFNSSSISIISKSTHFIMMDTG
jgi:hypothetical protein